MMRSKLCMMALAGLWFAPLAAAAPPAPVKPACPERQEALQITINNYVDALKPNADGAAILRNVDDIVAACPTEPYSLKAAATIYATVKAPDAKAAVKTLARSRELFRQMWANLKGDTPPIMVMGPDNTPIDFGFNDLYQIETQVRQLLFKAEEIAGELAPEDMPIGKGAPMRACVNGDYTDSQQAYFYLKEKDHAGAFNLLDREVQYCAAEIDKGQYPDILAHRARALIASVKRAGVDKPESLVRLKQARADADRFLKIRKGVYSAGFWWNSDDTELSALLLQAMVKQNAVPAKDTWFTAQGVADPMTPKFISMTLDAAWAEDSKVGLSGAYKIYRTAITELYTLAGKAPDPKAARKLLYGAAKDQAEGRIRAPGDEQLKPPPSFLYNWIDPDFAPAAPPSPSPTPAH